MGDKKVASLTTIDTEEEDKRHMGHNSLLNRIEKRERKKERKKEEHMIMFLFFKIQIKERKGLISTDRSN